MMKIESLRVNNFRGIRHFTFELERKNFVVAGTNGTGKSGVIDALEFGLTGKISRLSGRGTAGVSVKSHGPHVDFAGSPASAWVEIQFSLEAGDVTYTLRRSVAQPKTFTLTPNSQEAHAAVAWMNAHPEFALTRREIVRFVLAEGKSRGEDVAQLLGLERIPSMRSLLSRIANSDKKDLTATDAIHQQMVERMKSDYHLSSVDASALLLRANTFRSELMLPSSESPDQVSILEGVSATVDLAQGSANRDIWLDRLATLDSIIKNVLESALIKDLNASHAEAQQLAENSAFMDSLSTEGLLKAALAAFDNESCPVCGTPWQQASFLQVVEHKRDEGRAAIERLTQLRDQLHPLMETLRAVYASLRSCAEADTAYAEEALMSPIIESIMAEIETYGRRAGGISDATTLARFAESASLNIEPLPYRIQLISEWLDRKPKPSQADAARAQLRAFGASVESLTRQSQALREAQLKADQSSSISEIYNASTSDSLLKIYEAVESTFASFYAQINSDDESTFAATLAPSGAGLDMTVAFYDRGLYPPGAYHSEGHQDAMGLCLYLALARHTLGSQFTLSALDDVLMSIDAGHRKAVIALLSQEFPYTQFVVTTHDEQWMRQMKSSGFAKSKQVIQFRSWDVGRGPVAWRDYEPWDEIGRHIEANEPRLAAVGLRSYLEYVARELADAVHAPVAFRSDGHYTLGELFDKTVSEYRKVLRTSASAANSWGREEMREEIRTKERGVGQSALVAKQEEWAINSVVHFNEWENLGARELVSVVAAWKDLLRHFECDACGGMLSLSQVGGRDQSLTCMCGATLFSLVSKPTGSP
ncbi:AAA family ATPase [Clavibacter michiganensis]|uniref:AAA family ATPase n=1 Tax=Clavibacter michiganensis TaxID=28447 RepID=UPI003EC02BDB